MFNAGRYDWSLYVAHLSLEKILKARWVKDNEDKIPPKIYNLVKHYIGIYWKINDKHKIMDYYCRCSRFHRSSYRSIRSAWFEKYFISRISRNL
ncbi:MAG: HEPN domain-containing protein [Ignavibacteriaceae bacterium]